MQLLELSVNMSSIGSDSLPLLSGNQAGHVFLDSWLLEIRVTQAFQQGLQGCHPISDRAMAAGPG